MTETRKSEFVDALDQLADLRGTFTAHNRETSISFFAGLVLGVLYVKLLGMPSADQVAVGEQLATYLGAPAGAAGMLAAALKKYARK